MIPHKSRKFKAIIDLLSSVIQDQADVQNRIGLIFDVDIVHHGADFDTDTKEIASHLKSSAIMPQAKIPIATMIVAAETVCPRDHAMFYNNPKLEKNRVQIITKILRWHPQAATAPFFNGRTPLTQAIAHGGTWHQMGYHNGVSDFNNGNFGVLQLLWGYAPEQTLEIDPVSGLYPFMLAATILASQRNRNELERDHDVVDTVFCLLRK